MNWINSINTCACLLLLYYLLAAASQAGQWRHKFPVIAASVVVGLQAFDPLVAWIPDMAWPAMAMNATVATLVTIWRKKLWHMVVAEFNPSHVPLTRRSDVDTRHNVGSSA